MRARERSMSGVTKVSSWAVLHGRVTLFPAAFHPSSLPLARELYRQIWGNEHVSFQGQTSALAPSTAQGTRAGMTATCVAHPSRIDFSLTPAPSAQDFSGQAIATIPDAAQFRTELLSIVEGLEKI